MGFVIKLILKIAITALGLWVASHFLDLIHIDDNIKSLVLAAVVLGLVNAFVRPILTVLTLPLTVLTLGLFLIVINGLMIMLMGYLLKAHGVHVVGWINPMLAGLVVGLVSWVGHILIGEGKGAEKRH